MSNISHCLDLIGSEFAYLRLCEDRSWIAAFYRDGKTVEVDGSSPEIAMSNLVRAKFGHAPRDLALTPADGKTP